MRGLAWLLSESEKEIRGTDATPSALTDVPIEFTVTTEDKAPSLLLGVDVYIYSDAVLPTHPLRQLAEKQGILSLSYQKALGELTSAYRLIAVTGTHGKSSTTAFLAHILRVTGHDPSALVGAGIPAWPGKHALSGTSDVFVAEADEYRNHFHELTPAAAIITAIEYDHPDFFTSEEDMWKSYQTFINLLPSDGFLIIPSTLRRLPLSWPDITLEVEIDHDLPDAPIPGKHMQANAKLAISAAKQLGVDERQSQAALKTFTGLSRRFETVGKLGDMTVISDYGHHPTEIAATLTAVRERFPDKKVVAVFEAHMAERMQAFNHEFAKALSIADAVIIYPPYLPAGREGSAANVLRDQLVEAIQQHKTPVTVLHHAKELFSALDRYKDTYDIAIACTAGRLDADLRTVVLPR